MAKAAVTRSIRDDHQKNFLKIFNGLTGKHSRWEIWEDFVTLTAIEISNSTDKVNATERTKMYQTIISKYSAKERDGMAEMLAEVVMGMEQNPDQDFLGSLYMMCELGNDHAGQFFTPYDVCRCGATISLERGLAHYEFECGCCGLHAKGQTNIEDLEITIPCKCGNPITLHWDKDKRRYIE